MARNDAAEERDLVDQRDIDVRDQQVRVNETRGGRHGRTLRQVRNDLAQKQRTAGAHHIDGDADQRNIGLELKGEEAHHQTHQHADGQRGEQAPDPAVGVVGHERAGQRGEHHQALQTDVAEACLFDHDGRQRREQDGRGNADDREEKLWCQQHFQKVKHAPHLPSALRAQPLRQAPPAPS